MSAYSKTFLMASVIGLLMVQGMANAYVVRVKLYNDSGYNYYQQMKFFVDYLPTDETRYSPVGTDNGYSCNFNNSTQNNCNYENSLPNPTTGYTTKLGYVMPGATAVSPQRKMLIDTSCTNIQSQTITSSTQSVEVQVRLKPYNSTTNLVQCFVVQK